MKLLEAAKVRLAQAIAAQKKAISAQKAAMDRVLNDKAKLAAAVAALKAEEAQVKSIVDRLLKQQFGSSLPSPLSGRLDLADRTHRSGICSARERLSSVYFAKVWLRQLEDLSTQPKTARSGAPYFHNGVDISAPAGTPIYAAATGKVMIAGTCSYCVVWRGMRPLAWVWIAHSKSMVSIYGHIGDGSRIERATMAREGG